LNGFAFSVNPFGYPNLNITVSLERLFLSAYLIGSLPYYLPAALIKGCSEGLIALLLLTVANVWETNHFVIITEWQTK